MTATVNETHDPEFEQTVIDAVLTLGIDALQNALKTELDFSDFRDERCRLIFRAAHDLAKAGKDINILTVKNKLSEDGTLEKVGVVFLAGLGKGIPTTIKIESYAEQVLKNSRRRRLVSSLNNALQAAMSGNGDFDIACGDLIQDLNKQHREKAEHGFTRITEDRFRLEVPEIAATFEVDRLRREHHELIGELAVRSNLPGTRTFDGNLSIADFNLSSARARKERAGLLADRAGTKEIDWAGLLEELCQRVLSAERNGQPAVDLRELPKPDADDSIFIEGIRLPRRHPTILYGDGGAAKSYTGLYVAGRLTKQKLSVALFDWELAGEDHRDRLERLSGLPMPQIFYVRCERPLVYEADRLRRIVQENSIRYAIYDSIAFACDGPPESAEVAGRYFRAVRQIGIGSLHIAHVTKADGGDDKPFGSVFWHNGARATYFAKLAESSPDGKVINLGLFNKKANLGRLHQPTGFQIEFTTDRTYFEKSNPADTPDLAEKMTICQRMNNLLRGGAMSVEQISERLEAKPDTVRRTTQRHSKTFTILDGGKVALLQRDT